MVTDEDAQQECFMSVSIPMASLHAALAESEQWKMHELPVLNQAEQWNGHRSRA